MVGIVFFIVVFGLLVLVIQQLAKAGVRSIDKYEARIEKKRNEANNPYIQRHKVFKLDNDKNYMQYLKWCEENDQIPMNKDMYIREIKDKEKYLKDLIDSL